VTPSHQTTTVVTKQRPSATPPTVWLVVVVLSVLLLLATCICWQRHSRRTRRMIYAQLGPDGDWSDDDQPVRRIEWSGDLLPLPSDVGA
jgi:hypothetical protein